MMSSVFEADNLEKLRTYAHLMGFSNQEKLIRSKISLIFVVNNL